jgi:hypothetical protein
MLAHNKVSDKMWPSTSKRAATGIYGILKDVSSQRAELIGIDLTF